MQMWLGPNGVRYSEVPLHADVARSQWCRVRLLKRVFVQPIEILDLYASVLSQSCIL